MALKNQMLRFGLSGVAGYIVDSVVLYALIAGGLGFLRGRLLSFLCAVAVTWLLNRRYTFSQQLQSTVNSPSPLWLEFGRYLAAMSLGGLLNLATYWVVVAAAPSHPAIPALGVAAGSLVGMVANFASAKWWVFTGRGPAMWSTRPLLVLTTSWCLMLEQLIFWMCHLQSAALPGLYMDAVNPDYLAAYTLNPELANPRWMMPTALFPILGNLYHGVQNYYVGLPVFALLGFNMLALRIAQGLFGGGIVLLVHLVLQRATGSKWLALIGAAALATEVAFIGSFRTQVYIVIAGAFWLLAAVYLALGTTSAKRSADVLHPAAPSSVVSFVVEKKAWLLSGACMGLAVYSYFVFLFFIPVFVVAGWWHTRSWKAVAIWILGFVLGMQTYVLGYLSALVALDGFSPMLEWLRSASQDLSPMSAAQSLMERLANAWLLVWITLENASTDLLIFGSTIPDGWAVWKMRLLVAAPLLLIALNVVERLRPRQPAADGTTGLLGYWQLAWLPIAFVAVSLIFGGRLWAHHFSPMVPLGYLILLLAVYQFSKSVSFTLPRWIGAGLALCLVLGNLQQQDRFFDRLEASGGAGRFSNAINRMADDALSLSPELVHVFPEWGFMMPFSFLTANQRRYETDISPANLSRLANQDKTLRLYYWEAGNGDSYRDSLLAQGFQIRSNGSYQQRDQQIAFYWMEAVAGTTRNRGY